MFELTYRSVAQKGLTEEDIRDILNTATEFNNSHDISGCLVLHGGYFLQVLEGEQKVVQELYEQITQDPRHYDVTLLWEGNKESRSFEGWSMAFKELEQEDTHFLETRFFEKNLMMLAELVDKPTATLRIFWTNVRQLISRNGNDISGAKKFG